MTPRKTRFSTNPEQAASERQALDEAIEALQSAPDEALPFERLADLSRPAVQRLRERWHELVIERRLRVVDEMVKATEASVERNYERALLVAFDDADADVRRRALDGLWEHESDAFLTRLLDDVEAAAPSALRLAELDALAHYAVLVELEELEAPLAERLTASLKRIMSDDPDLAMRRMALESAAYLSSDDAISDAIAREYASADTDARVSAVRAMGRQALTRWLTPIETEFASSEPELRFEAARAAGGLSDQRLVSGLIDLVDDEDVEVQFAAIASLGAIGGRLAINTLRRLSQADKLAIAEAAQEALDEAELGLGRLTPRL
jgi:HEAT repeat protein